MNSDLFFMGVSNKNKTLIKNYCIIINEHKEVLLINNELPMIEVKTKNFKKNSEITLNLTYDLPKFSFKEVIL